MATRNPKRLAPRRDLHPAPTDSFLYQQHREILRARAAGAQAALDRLLIEDNPYHRVMEDECYRHWEIMYLKTRRVIREAQLANAARTGQSISIDEDI